jgi:hypothetical protein
MLKKLILMAGLILSVTTAVVPGDPPAPPCLPCAR